MADENGDYPEESVHGKVIARLQEIAEADRDEDDKEEEKSQGKDVASEPVAELTETPAPTV